MELKTKQRLQVKACIESLENIDELSRLFFKELFHLDLSLERVFPGNVVALNHKFSNMLNTLKNVKHLEKITESLASMGERHLQNYGVQVAYFDTAQQALLTALAETRNLNLEQNGLKEAWQSVFSDVADLMKQAMQKSDRRSESRLTQSSFSTRDLLAEVGGKARITQVHQRFYDVMFDHPWLEQFFYGKSKESLVMKQTQFMVAAFGGENRYTGDTPAFAHMHMYITPKMLDVRQEILRQAILDEGLSEETAEAWLQVDDSFRHGIVKKTVDDCVLKCVGQAPVVIKDRTY